MCVPAATQPSAAALNPIRYLMHTVPIKMANPLSHSPQTPLQVWPRLQWVDNSLDAVRKF